MRRLAAVAVALGLAALVAAAACSNAEASGTWPGFRKFRKISSDGTAAASAAPAIVPLLLFATDAGSGMGAECGNAVVTTTDGGTMTYARTGAAICTKSDGTLVVLSANRPPVQASPGGVLGVLVEGSAINQVRHSRDMTQSEWTASNMTVAFTATSPALAANAASTLTATSADATVKQTITIASATRATSVYLKRRTGSGEVDLTRDNGSTWINVTSTLTSSWSRFTPALYAGLSTTAANPTVGIRIRTSGDAVDAAYWVDEVGSQATSPVDNTSASTGVRQNAQLHAVWPVAAASNWSMSFDTCIYNPAPVAWTAASIGTFITDRAGLGIDSTGAILPAGWYGFGPNLASTTGIADAPSMGSCRHLSASWVNTSKTITAAAYSNGVSLGTASRASDAGISDADTIDIGYAFASGAPAAQTSNLYCNLCVSDDPAGCL